MSYLSAREIIENFYANSSNTALTYVHEDKEQSYSVSYKDLADTVLGLANFFYNELNLKTGDTISYLFENCPEIITLNLACFLNGLKACPLDSKRDTSGVALKKLKETEAKVFFFRKNDNQTVAGEIAKNQNLKSFAVEDFFDLKRLIKNPNKKILDKFDPEKIALILYTSGTTGFPKGAMLTFGNLRSGAKQVGEWFKVERNDNFYLVLPLHHINSTIFALSILFANGTLVIPSRYSGSHFFSDCAKYAISMSSIVPTINLDLLEKEEEFRKYKDGLKLKRIQLGSAPVSPKHATEFVKKYGIKLVQGYGSTETSLRVTGVPVDLPDDLYQDLLETNSIGTPLSENEVVIFDKDDEPINSPEMEGEIGVRGNNIMQGYLNRAKETKDTLRGGYFHTGDLGYFKKINGQKYYYLKGRIKEIIIKGGVNISPLFIEERLREQVKWIKDVVVVGFSHYRLGEEIGAIFIPKDTDYKQDFEQTLKYLKENKIKNLDTYETPKAAIVAQDFEIPKTATGKVQHIKAKEVFEKRLLDTYKTIGKNGKIAFKLILPDDKETLEKAILIHNSAFPKGLSLDMETITHRATNGFVIGAYDKENILQGVLTGFFTREGLIKNGKNWGEISGDGKFTTADRKGDVAVLASAASSTSTNKNEDLNPKVLKNLNLTEDKVLNYIESKKDFVVNFHFMPKAGFSTGAKVNRIILNGNPNDLPSLGIVVIFEYPRLSSLNHQFTEEKIGLGLVEMAIKYAKDNGKKKVYPLSRLGEAYKYLTS